MNIISFLRQTGEKIAAKKRSRFDIWLSFICLFLSIGILLTSVTTAWIRRKWSTSVYEDNLKIETSGALAFILDGQTTAQNAISILSQLGLTDLTLKPVSNLTGKSDGFFTLNKTTRGHEFFEHLSVPTLPSERTIAAKANGYIEFRFTLLGENVPQDDDGDGTTVHDSSTEYYKYVYLKDDSFISVYDPDDIVDGLDPSQALRVSISVGNADPIILRNPIEGVQASERLKHTGINSTTDNDTWIAGGATYYDENGAVATTFTYGGTEYDLVEETQAHELSEYNGGIYTVGDDRYVTAANCICSFSSSARQEITVRIWLEGTDPVCEDAIAGLRLKLFLNFEAVNCVNLKIIERTE